jgi:hypothetical protein
MINITDSDYSRSLGALLAMSPVRAARGGALGVIRGAVAEQTPFLAERIEASAAGLTAALSAESVFDVPDRLARLSGRPPVAVTAALRSPEMVEALCMGLDQLGFPELRELVEQWGPQEGGELAAVPLRPQGLIERAKLIDGLRERAVQILTAWGEASLEIGLGDLRMDGRTLATASRVWQVPVLTGSMRPAPTAAAALHPNRLGRSAAAVAFAKINEALASEAPIDAVAPALALLVAIGEAITSVSSESEAARVRSARSGLPVSVRLHAPVRGMSRDVHAWWPFFASWGASERRSVITTPTAWRLSPTEADVILWVLTRVAASLAVAASAPRRRGRLLVPFDWAAHVEREAPIWEAGASSVCALMQRGRLPQLRTKMPSGPLPSVYEPDAWPWRPTGE